MGPNDMKKAEMSADILQELGDLLRLNRDVAAKLCEEFHENNKKIKEIMARNDEIANELARLEISYHELNDWQGSLSGLGS